MPPRFPRFAPFLLLAAVVFGPGCMALSGRLHRPAEITGNNRIRHDGYYFYEKVYSSDDDISIRADIFWPDGTMLRVDGPYLDTAEQAHVAFQERLRVLTGGEREPRSYTEWGTYRVVGDALEMRLVVATQLPNPSRYEVIEDDETITSDTSYATAPDRVRRFRRFDGLPSSRNWTMRWRR